MAGESPDRSKQHESSTEPTPGSGAPVPGPTAGVRDPRLAVAGEKGRADQATAVFSTREPRDSAGSAVDGAGAGAQSEGAGSSEEAVRDGAAGRRQGEATRGDGTGSDERLRAALASWIRSADDSGADADSADDSSADDSAADDNSADDNSADANGADDNRTEDSGNDVTGDKTAGKAPAEASDASFEKAGEKPTEKPSDVAAKAEPSVRAGVESEGTDEAEAKAGGVREAEGTDGDTPEAKATTEGKFGTKSAVKDVPEGRTGSGGASAGGNGAVVAPVAAPADKQAPEAETESAAGRMSETESAAEPTPGTESAAGGTPEAGGSADSGPRGEDAPEAGAAEGSTAPKPHDDQPTAVFKPARRPAVDQPTTMLKLGGAEPADKPGSAAVAKPPAPGVDQPTTMLKLGGAKPSDKPAKGPADKPTDRPTDGPTDKPTTDKPATDKPATDKPAPTWAAKAPAPTPDKLGAPDANSTLLSASAPASKPPAESLSERTSKFVRLKDVDESARPKPTPAPSPAEATAALPKVGPERTAQQPLPPKPPLDLLAELTNTPPPPETPVRTIVRRIKIWTPLVVLLAVIFAIVQAVRPLPSPTLTLTAADSYSFSGGQVTLPWPSEGQGWMDVDGIGTMGGFGKQTPVAIGSVAKSMTAYLILKDHPLKPGQEGPTITVDATAAKEAGYDKTGGESTLSTVKEGDKLTEKQALSAVMIPSANNIARLLARWDAGTEAAFIQKMNDMAKQLGMTHTTYTDASGLKKTTVSTAEDQVKLGHELVRIPALIDITKLPTWTDPSGRVWRNYNGLVPYNNAIGIKTGSTTAAGGNLLFAATKEVGGKTAILIGAVLSQQDPVSIIDKVNTVSKTALIAAQNAMTSAKILKKGDVVGYVDDGFGDHTPVVVTEDVTAVGWAGLKVQLSLAAGHLPHSAKAGALVGTLTVGDGSGDAVRVPVALQKDLAEPGYGSKFTRLG